MSDHVLVIGAGGFIGRHLVQALAAAGDRVIAVSRRSIPFQSNNIESIACEAKEPEHYAPWIARSRVVVHVASRSTPGSTVGNALADLEENLRPTLALLQAMQQKPQINLLYLSSGGTLYGNDSGHIATEASAVAPRSYHGAGKIAAEHFIAAWSRQYGGAATIVRPSNVYGPGQNERSGFGIIPACFGKMSRGETLTVWGDGSTVRDYLYIGDFIDLCQSILSCPMSPGATVLNAASGVGVSLNELFLQLENITGIRLLRIYDAARKVDTPRVVIDPTLAESLYGWMPTTPLNQGLENAWHWFNTTQH